MPKTSESKRIEICATRIKLVLYLSRSTTYTRIFEMRVNFMERYIVTQLHKLLLWCSTYSLGWTDQIAQFICNVMLSASCSKICFPHTPELRNPPAKTDGLCSLSPDIVWVLLNKGKENVKKMLWADMKFAYVDGGFGGLTWRAERAVPRKRAAKLREEWWWERVRNLSPSRATKPHRNR